MDHLSRALAQAERDDAHVAVLFLDLARFKLVNDSYGHGARRPSPMWGRLLRAGGRRAPAREAAARRPLMERTLRAAPTLS